MVIAEIRFLTELDYLKYPQNEMENDINFIHIDFNGKMMILAYFLG